MTTKTTGKKTHKFLVADYVTELSNVEAPLLDTQISCFDLNENPDVEITYSQIQDDVFFLERSIMEMLPGPSTGIQGTGPPRPHNQYGSGDMSDLLVDDFGCPIHI